MAYKKNIYKFENAIEVEEYHTAKYGAPGQKRQSKSKPTPEQVEKRNQYNREKTARRKLRAHFQENDYFSVLTYKRANRPASMAAAKEHFRVFLRKVRSEYRKRGYEVKWLRNIEVGTKNGWHIHLVINRIPDTDVILQEAWEHGAVINLLLYKRGEFRELAAYITKTPKTDSKLREADYSASRNLPIPDPEEKVYLHWKSWRAVKVPEGFFFDKDSCREGVNPFSGYRYRTYTLLRLDRKDQDETNKKG